MSSTTTVKNTVDYVRNALKHGKRLDGRKLDEFRTVVVERGTSKNAEGSSRVKIGDSEVIAGVKFALSTPYPDSPDKGTMTTSAEYLPMAHPSFEAGKPGEDEVEISRVVDRAIRESKLIDFGKLCLEEGKKVWTIYLDILVLNHDGNLIDACGLAAVAAIQNAKLPKVEQDAEGEWKIVDGEYKGKVPLEGTPISITIKKLDDKFIVDTTAVEEEAVAARVTMGTLDGNRISSMQMGGAGQFSPADIQTVANLALKTADKIRKEHFKN